MTATMSANFLEFLLSVKLLSQDYSVVINFLISGFCISQLAREKPSLPVSIARYILNARPREVGSRTLVHAASAGEETHGQYLHDCNISDLAPLVLSREEKEIQSRI